jgi:hypothetical protein
MFDMGIDRRGHGTWRMPIRSSSLILGMVLGLASLSAHADAIFTVGPSGDYATISAAVSAADSDPSTAYVIEVTPGTYTNDFSVVTHAMTIEVDPDNPGQVLLIATVPPPNQKGIITTSASLTVNGLTFKGAAVDEAAGSNGAGIRDQAIGAATLDIENSIFEDDQDGILTGANSAENVIIRGSSFISNGFDAGNGNCPSDGCDHAIYIGAVNSLLVADSLFCGTLVGHDIKSRAAATTITGNQLYDGAPDSAINCPAGSTSFAIDLPNGGDVTISGNQIIQGANSQNAKMVAYGEEGLVYADNSLLLSDNDFTSTGVANSIGVNDPPCVPVHLRNNSFQGVDTQVDPPSCVASVDQQPVPEPSSLLLLLSALVGSCALAARAAIGA